MESPVPGDEYRDASVSPVDDQNRLLADHGMGELAARSVEETAFLLVILPV